MALADETRLGWVALSGETIACRSVGGKACETNAVCLRFAKRIFTQGCLELLFRRYLLNGNRDRHNETLVVRGPDQVCEG
jgi:hypothetical protein